MTALTDRRPPLQLHRRLRRPQPFCFPRHRDASSDCNLAGSVPAHLATVP